MVSTNCGVESTPTLAHLFRAKPGKSVGRSADEVFHTVLLCVAVYVCIISSFYQSVNSLAHLYEPTPSHALPGTMQTQCACKPLAVNHPTKGLGLGHTL